ncbi:MAG TPA: ferredoxin [Clostridiales bacterium]|nr:ferredoxin [Clostridiales bacterium]
MERAFYLDKNKCEGCTNCMRKCPTEAIRIINGKAVINDDKCIHCGECIRVCPYNAYNSITDKIDDINKKKFSIAIPSTAVYGQFHIGTEICNIHKALLSMGFDDVYDESWGADLVSKAVKNKVRNMKDNRPVINSNCPAVLRLIKVKYPSLIDNIIQLQSPMEVSAILARKKAKEIFGKNDEDVEVFYISPCPAKSIRVYSPIVLGPSKIDRVISLKEIYGDLIREMKMHHEICYSNPSIKGLKWSLSGGQCEAAEIEHGIAVSGIENVLNILEEIEMGKLNHIEFVELMSCNESCVGGPFNFENPFVAKNNINYIIKNTDNTDILNDDLERFEEFDKLGYFEQEITLGLKNTEALNIKAAIERLESINQMVKILPKIDCGSCGSPTCRALAEDIVDGINTIESCVILKLKK